MKDIPSDMVTRIQENFKEALRKEAGNFTNIRLLDAPLLARVADADAVNKSRLGYFRDREKLIRRFSYKSGDYEDMEEARCTKETYGTDARDFALEDNVAMIYFNCYGENFEGGEIIDDPDQGWTCPGCKMKYVMTLKGLPDTCKRCGWLSPLGRLKKDGFLRR